MTAPDKANGADVPRFPLELQLRDGAFSLPLLRSVFTFSDVPYTNSTPEPICLPRHSPRPNNQPSSANCA
jgi:hypothetical protein